MPPESFRSLGLFEAFGIPTRLPAGSIVIDRPVSIFEQHHDIFIAAIILLAVLTVLVAFLTAVIAMRRKAETYWIRNSVRPVWNEARTRVIRVLGAAKDVTEGRRAGDRLLYQAGLLKNVSDAIAAADMGQRITSWNRAAVRLIGLREDQAIGCPLFATLGIKTWSMEDGPSAPTAPWHGEAVIERADGTTIDVHADLSLVTNTAGENIGVMVSLRDITAARKAAEARRKHEAELRQAQKIEEIGRLVGGIAHDFNNLLTVIQGYCELGSTMVPEGHPIAEPLSEIMKANGRAESLIQKLLAFSRRQILSPVILDLNALVMDLKKTLERLIGESITLDTRLAPHLLRVTADPSQLEQVILNLVVNARDATADGGTITIATTNVDLEEGFSAHPDAPVGRCVMFSVSDTGSGMDEATKARLFEPFFTTKERGKGAGLGLATAYGIVTQSGGHIVVKSEPGHGSVFKVILPAMDLVDQTAEAPALQSEQKLSGGTETMLFREDEKSVRTILDS
jgi:PAS domain S-box-containing protein